MGYGWLNDDGSVDKYHGIADDMRGDVLSLVREIKQCLSVGLYQSAIRVCLTLPDICGHVAFPDIERVGKRYILWCDKYVVVAYSLVPNDCPYTLGELLYQLRCSLLHAGNTDIDLEKYFKDRSLSQPDIGLKIDSRIDNESFYCSAYVDSSDVDMCYIRLDVRQVCKCICNAVCQFVENSAGLGFDKYSSPIVIQSEGQWSVRFGEFLYNSTVGALPDDIFEKLPPTEIFQEALGNGVVTSLGTGVRTGLNAFDGVVIAEIKRRGFFIMVDKEKMQDEKSSS